MAVREWLRRRTGVELPGAVGLPVPVALGRGQRTAARRPGLDMPGAARVVVELEPVDVEQADVRIHIRIVLTVPLIVDDLHRSVVAQAVRIGGRRGAERERVEEQTREDHQETRCLAHL
jgi:hypothetical protein